MSTKGNFFEEMFGVEAQGIDIMDLQYYKGLKNRELILNSDIDVDTIEKYVFPIIRWNKEDEEAGIPVEKRKPIKIYISCVGGIVALGMTLCDTIKASKTPIQGITLSYAYSMGFLILLACHKRSGLPFSSYLLHDGSMMVANSTSKVKNYMEYQDEVEAMLKKFILDNSKISEEQYEKNYTTEWYMTAKKALELGVIDEITTTII